MTPGRLADRARLAAAVDRLAAMVDHGALLAAMGGADLLDAVAHEIERLQAEGERVGRSAYVAGYQAGHEDTVDGHWTSAPGERWDEDDLLRADVLTTPSRAGGGE